MRRYRKEYDAKRESERDRKMLTDGEDKDQESKGKAKEELDACVGVEGCRRQRIQTYKC